MRYISEFKIPLDVVAMDKELERRIEYSKEAGARELGSLIGSKVGWEEKPDEGKHFVLEVQCFAQKDWRAFKEQLKLYVETANTQGLSIFNLIVIGKMLRELEEKELMEPEKEKTL